MKKNLVSIGNSLGVIIEKRFIDLLGIDKKTEVIMVSDGKHLIIKPIKNGALAAKPKTTPKKKKSSSSVKATTTKKKKSVSKSKTTSGKTKKKQVRTRRLN